jgi:hypothetical protein
LEVQERKKQRIFLAESSASRQANRALKKAVILLVYWQIDRSAIQSIEQTSGNLEWEGRLDSHDVEVHSSNFDVSRRADL